MAPARREGNMEECLVSAMFVSADAFVWPASCLYVSQDAHRFLDLDLPSCYLYSAAFTQSKGSTN